VELVMNPDPILTQASRIVVTADSAILDQCGRWVNLARAVLDRSLPQARRVDLSS
jgi:hypothetical protein